MPMSGTGNASLGNDVQRNIENAILAVRIVTPSPARNTPGRAASRGNDLTFRSICFNPHMYNCTYFGGD